MSNELEMTQRELPGSYDFLIPLRHRKVFFVGIAQTLLLACLGLVLDVGHLYLTYQDLRHQIVYDHFIMQF